MSLKVIGAGGPRTGTASLHDALEILGFGNCYHMQHLFNNPDDIKYWVELFETGTTDFESMLDGFQSTVDIPGYLHYKKFLELYPDAKVVLSNRDPEEWYESAINTVYAVTPQTIGQKLGMLKKMILSKRFRKISKAFMLVEKYLWKGHYQGKFKDKEHTLNIYRNFNQEVIDSVPADQLLLFDPKDGWEPLCNFLEVPVPNVPYPFKNKRKEFKEQIREMMETGGQLTLK